MSSDLEDELRRLLADRAGYADRMPIELTESAPAEPGLGDADGRNRAAERVRRFAPLAAAFGVVVAATAGLLVANLTMRPPAEPLVPPAGNTVSAVSGVDPATTTTLRPVPAH